MRRDVSFWDDSDRYFSTKSCRRLNSLIRVAMPVMRSMARIRSGLSSWPSSVHLCSSFSRSGYFSIRCTGLMSTEGMSKQLVRSRITSRPRARYCLASGWATVPTIGGKLTVVSVPQWLQLVVIFTVQTVGVLHLVQHIQETLADHLVLVFLHLGRLLELPDQQRRHVYYVLQVPKQSLQVDAIILGLFGVLEEYVGAYLQIHPATVVVVVMVAVVRGPDTSAYTNSPYGQHPGATDHWSDTCGQLSLIVLSEVSPQEVHEMGDKTYAKVMIEMRAQLEDEMDLHKDEVLIITEIVDKMYFRGQSADGTRVGIIPKRFVHILDHIPPNGAYQLRCSPRQLVFINAIIGLGSVVTISDPLLDMTSTATTPANGAHNHHIYTNDSSLYENTSDINDCPMDSPPSYDHVISSMMYSEAPVAQPSSLGYNNAYVGDVQSYGRALFSFHAVFPNELSLRENEIVHLIRHIDGDWIEGECDGRVGIFPKSFVEIIVDCDRNNSITAADESHLSGGAVGDHELFPTDTFGRVLYDFDGEIETDLR
ncbi:unnamed protein product, partial [Oppiella nova]